MLLLLFIMLYVLLSYCQFVKVGIGSGSCLTIVMKDGFSNTCYDQDTWISIGEDIYRYDELVLFVHEKSTNNIVSLEYVQIPYELRNSRQSERLLVTWPSWNSVITSNLIDLHYYFQHSNVDLDNTKLCIDIQNPSMNYKSPLHCLNMTSQFTTINVPMNG